MDIKTNQRANKVLKQLFLSEGITRCENCGSDWWLTFAHRRKRRFYRTIEDLTDFNDVLLLCIKCHQEIEFNRDLTDKMFSRLRGGKIGV